MLLNEEEYHQWTEGWDTFGIYFKPIMDEPPEGMFHEEYTDAPEQIVVGYTVEPGTKDTFMFEFTPNTYYLEDTPIKLKG